jgi:hypothetical protein
LFSIFHPLSSLLIFVAAQKLEGEVEKLEREINFLLADLKEH